MERTPSLAVRLTAMVYETLLLLAVLFFAAFLFVTLTQAVHLPRFIFQGYLLAVIAVYFLWFWTHGGQTLAMKTWRIKLLAHGGEALTVRRALLRFLLAWLSVGLAGMGIIWAWFDLDRQFLHDRLAHTRLVTLDSLGN